MDHQFCPGSKFMRQPKPEFMDCSYCGEEVEIWSDEVKARCPGCGKTVMREGNMACLEWCQFAEDCVGEAIYGEFVSSRMAGIKGRLLSRVEKIHGPGSEPAVRAQRAQRAAERLAEAERANPRIIIAAAILAEVPLDTARRALLELGLRMQDIEEVCRIVAALQAGSALDTAGYRVAHDAVVLAVVADGSQGEETGRTPGDLLLTDAGRELAAAGTAAG